MNLQGPREFAGAFRVNCTNIPATGNQVQLLAANPNRVSVHFGLNQGTTVYFSPDPPFDQAAGFQLSSSFPIKSFTFSQDGGIVQGAWWLQSQVAGGSIYTAEVIWLPEVEV